VTSNFAAGNRGRQLAGLLLLLLAPAVFAAPGFVNGALVVRSGNIAEVSIQLACRVEYISHLPITHGQQLRVQVESTGICSGAPPTIVNTRGQYRPLNADSAKLTEISYESASGDAQTLTLAFSEAVQYEVALSDTKTRVIVRVRVGGTEQAPSVTARSGVGGVRVHQPATPQPEYVINLSSSRDPHTASDKAIAFDAPELTVFETEVVLGGITWYRLRLGIFASRDAAERELNSLRSTHPTAWIDRASKTTAAAIDETITDDSVQSYASNAALASLGLDQIDALMADARSAMVAGEVSRAVQIYTKVLRAPNHDRHAEAQEYLALAREKNGQNAHARAEYKRYLALYPNSDGAARVSQRLAALLASDRQAAAPGSAVTTAADSRKQREDSDWRVQTFASQYYRRDVNQINEEDEVVSQSAIYSDINLDVRRRGSRFDFSSRLSAGYRSDLLAEDEGSGNQLRLSYAYADLADAKTGLRGRIGRQSRNSGGVLGRFDGLNVGYRASERILVNAVAGQPVNSATDGLDSEKTFYGLSASYGPIIDGLELGVFFVQQDIEGIDDRQAVGTEIRYFGDNKSLWGLIDYDTLYQELSSAFLQGSWRFASRLTINGSIDRRHSPYLSTGSALIGQPVSSFAELLILMTEDEIQQLSLDRSPLSSSYTVGLSYSLSPKLQISADANQTTVDATPASGGIAATEENTYQYFSTTLVASSLLKEGDVSMLSLRFSDSDTTKVTSLTLDTRFPIGKRWRINPRLRVDQRSIMADSSDEWLYTPGLRIQYRHNRKFRVEFEVGKQFAKRQLADTDLDRETYFVNLGYQAFF